MNIAKDLRHVTALDLGGEARELGSFWQEKPAVLVFVRHFG